MLAGDPRTDTHRGTGSPDGVSAFSSASEPHAVSAVALSRHALKANAARSRLRRRV